jgi:hypothetical protein
MYKYARPDCQGSAAGIFFDAHGSRRFERKDSMGKSIHLCEKISEHTSLLANHSALYLLMDCLSAYDLPGHSHDGARSLLDPRFEHESCGVGFVATLTNRASHSILQQALTALARLAHRGAIAADGRSSDGVGVMTGIPREFLLNEIGAHLDADKPLAVGVVFLPQDSEASVAKLEACLKDQGIRVLGWRAVPTRNDARDSPGAADSRRTRRP